MPNNRVDKLNSEFQKNIYETIVRKVKDPRLTEMFSITKVTCDKELTYAKVYVSIFSTDQDRIKNTFTAITSSANFVRSCLLKSMRIRAVPQLAFVLDDYMEQGDKIDKLLDELKNNENNNSSSN